MFLQGVKRIRHFKYWNVYEPLEVNMQLRIIKKKTQKNSLLKFTPDFYSCKVAESLRFQLWNLVHPPCQTPL